MMGKPVLITQPPDEPERRSRKSDMPVSTLDVGRYILRKLGPMGTVKLQKLVCYCQAWSLVWDDRPLFSEPIEAWE